MIPLTIPMELTNLFFSSALFPISSVKLKGILYFFIALLLTRGLAVSLYAQSSERTLLTEEIQSIEKTLKTSDLSGTDRYKMLVRQAQLFQLSGNLEKAAQTWTDAAFAEQGKRDDTALLAGAFCFLAMGEMEKAEASVRTVSLTGKDSRLMCNARYLSAQINAFQFGDISHLIELITDSDYEGYRPAIYYTLWKISGTDTYKTRLLSEYPLSPESRIVKGKGAVSAAPSAMWLLYPGLDILEIPTETTAAAPQDNGPKALQTGLFGREENAKLMADRLKTAGFDAAIDKRTINDGGIYWVVTVPLGVDVNRTMARLKDKGFDSFPVF
jgi:hypothetical protein